MAMSIHIGPEDFEELKPVDACIKPATIGKATYVPSKVEGKFPYYMVPFSFEDDDGKHRTVTRIFSLSPKAKPFLARLLKAVDMAPEEGQGMDFEFDDLEGETVRIAIAVGSWKDDQGEEHLRNEVAKVLPPK